MIGSFKHKGVKTLYLDDDRRKLPPDMVERIAIILGVLAVAETIDEVAMPTFRLHALKGNRKNQFSVTVRANWRIVFRFEDGFAEDIDLVDYH